MERWHKLPEWARWILCWPLILLFTVLVGVVTIFLASSILAGSFLPRAVTEAVAPALATFLSGPTFFFFIHLLVPRKPSWFTGFFVFLSSALGIMSVIRWGLELSSGQFEAGPFFQDFLQAVTAVGVSWYWFLYFKRVQEKHGGVRL